MASTKRFAELGKKNEVLILRMQVITPKVRGDAGTRLREAQDNFQKRLDLTSAKLNEMQKRIDELKSKQR